MLPLPHIRTIDKPNHLRRIVRAVDEYTLWAFNPQHHLVRGYAEPVRQQEDRAA